MWGLQQVTDSANKLIHTFGWTTLSILFLVYWSQGFRQFGTVAITYFFKDELNLEPASAQYLRSISFIAWYIKPLYGMVSDNVPICGMFRKPYLFLAGIVGTGALVSFLWLKGEVAIVAVLVMFELSEAVADVLADALMVQEARKDPESGSSLLQSFCWFVLALGGLIGGPLGGLALEYISAKYVIALQAFAPMLLVLSAFIFTEFPAEENIGGLSVRIHKLYDIGKSPKVLYPCLFIYLSSATVPGFSQTTIYFCRDELHFSSTFISLLMCIGYLTICFGSVLYTWKLKSKSLRSVISVGQLLMAFSSVFELMLVSRANHYYQIPDKALALFTDSLTGAISFTCKSMPLFVLSANLCPPGVEATLFALLASVGNFGFFTSEFLGGVMVDFFGVKQGNYQHFWLVILIRGLLRMSPLLYIRLIPDETGELDSQKPASPPSPVERQWELAEKFNEEI